MKKYLIMFLICLLPLIVFAAVDTWDGVTGIDTWDGQTGVDTIDGQTIAAASSYHFDEDLEASGYAETSTGNGSNWAETEDSANSVNPDKTRTDVTGAPADWGDDCLEITSPAESDNVTQNTLDSAQADTWIRFEVIIESEDLANGAKGYLAYMWNTGAAAGVMYIKLYQDGSGNLKFVIGSNHDGAGAANHEYTGFPTLSLDTRYRVELKWNATNNLWAWRIDGTDQPNDQDATDPVESEGALTSTHPVDIERVSCGARDFGTVGAYTAAFDHITVDLTDWVGAP